MKYQYIAIRRTTCVPKMSKSFVVCLSTWRTLKGFRLKRQYLSLAAERLPTSERFITFPDGNLTAGVWLRRLPLRWTVRTLPNVSVLEGIQSTVKPVLAYNYRKRTSLVSPYHAWGPTKRRLYHYIQDFWADAAPEVVLPQNSMIKFI